MKKLFPIILILLGVGIGGGAGIFLQKPADMMECDPEHEDCEMNETAEDHGVEEGHDETADAGDETPEATTDIEYVALQRQIIVPIVADDQVISLMVLSLSIEVHAGGTLVVYEREPKLRDAFLQVLFRHANTGGFAGAFTTGEKMSDLRHALNGAAESVLGDFVVQVLVTEILRQSV